MVVRVYFERIADAGELDHDMESAEQRPNVSVRVKNTDSLDEYRGESFCNPQFFEKI